MFRTTWLVPPILLGIACIARSEDVLQPAAQKNDDAAEVVQPQSQLDKQTDGGQQAGDETWRYRKNTTASGGTGCPRIAGWSGTVTNG